MSAEGSPSRGCNPLEAKVFGSRSPEAGRIRAFFAETEQATKIIGSLRHRPVWSHSPQNERTHVV